MKKCIPNIITLCNLLCGCIAINEALYGNFVTAALLVLLSCVCDFLDGFVARALKVHSDIGVQLDSLADVVSFGVVPSFFAFILLKNSLVTHDIVNKYIPYLAFAIALCSAFRLAKFNVSGTDKSHFIGMPTPANAILWTSILILLSFNDFIPYPTFIYTYFVDPLSSNIDKVLMYNCYDYVQNFINHPITLSALIIYSSLMLISPIKMFSFKIKFSNLSKNLPIFVFLWTLLILFYFFGMISVVVCIAIIYPLIRIK